MSGQQQEPAVAGAESSGAETSGVESSGVKTSGAVAQDGTALPARDDTPPAQDETPLPDTDEATSARDDKAPARGTPEEAHGQDLCRPRSSPAAAADAFDLLYGANAPALRRQAFVLCGGPALARRSVTHAFRLAWHRWPQVAVDPDPAGWVRAAAHRFALAPWRGFRPVHLVRRVRAMRHVPPRDRTLFDALLRLPPSYRAALLLHDGLGLSLGDTAAEVEAGTAATSGRLRHARAALAERVPVLRDASPEDLPRVTALLVQQLVAPQPASLPPARSVRRSSEVRGWCGTAAGLGLVVAVAAAGFTLVATDHKRNVPLLPVPKPSSATLAPERQPGRLRPMAGDGALHVAYGKTGGPAPCVCREEAGPSVVRA